MFSEGYKTKYYNQQLRRQTSSGSSGVPVNVYYDYMDWYASNMCLWRKRLQWYGIRPSDKYCIFTLNGFNQTPEVGKLYYIIDQRNILCINISLIRTDAEYDKMVALINDFHPSWLYIQPFVLNNLIKAYKRLSLSPSYGIKYIESVGEILTSDLRRRAKDLFEICITNMYGSEEMNGIAIEDTNGKMKILDDNVFLEVMDENVISCSGCGASIITNLYNRAMPLIRYVQGDAISIENNVIEVIHGRTLGNQIKDPKIKYQLASLSELMAEANNDLNDIIIEYKFIYKVHNNELICHIRIDENTRQWSKTVSDYIKKLFAVKSMGVIKFDVDLSYETINKKYSKNQLLIIEE